MYGVINLDADMAAEVYETRKLFDDLFAHARLMHARALFAYHKHEKASRRWDEYTKAFSKV